MDINVTVILLALQFMCVYYFLYKFLFIPAAAILDEEQQFKNDLYKDLEHNQQIKDALLQDYHVKNSAFKNTLIQDIPAQVTESVYQKSAMGPTSYSVEKDQLPEQDKKEIELFLVDRLSRVIEK